MKNCPDCQDYKEALEFCSRTDLFTERGAYTMRERFQDVARRALEIVAVRNRKTEPVVKGLPAYAQTTPPLCPSQVGDA